MSKNCLVQGFIKIHRSMLDWEWYDDKNAKILFLHLLLTANFEDKKWRGVFVKRGQLITSIESLAKSTSLSTKQVRLAIDKLKKTNEITIKTTNKFSLIELTNYTFYQEKKRKKDNQKDEQKDNQETNKGQTKDKRRATTKEVLGKPNTKEVLGKPNTKAKPLSFQKPSVQEISGYCKEQKNLINPTVFYDYYESKGWKIGNSPMKDWKATLRRWQARQNEKVQEQSRFQRIPINYDAVDEMDPSNF
jgi:hypothetical protein